MFPLIGDGMDTMDIFMLQPAVFSHLAGCPTSLSQAEAVKKPQAMHGSVISKLKAIHAGPDGIVVPWKKSIGSCAVIPCYTVIQYGYAVY